MELPSLIALLRSDYPDISFDPADTFYWSSKKQIIYYNPQSMGDKALWATLHELSHGLLDHHRYSSDFELLQLEREAWDYAENLAKKYQIEINKGHIEDCLDTYRDWLNKRSTCPNCGVVAAQVDHLTYSCHLCSQEWKVSNQKQCRPYRLTTQLHGKITSLKN